MSRGYTRPLPYLPSLSAPVNSAISDLQEKRKRKLSSKKRDARTFFEQLHAQPLFKNPCTSLTVRLLVYREQGELREAKLLEESERESAISCFSWSFLC